MFQPTLVSSVVVWERILEIEEQKRLENRIEDVLPPAPVPPEKVIVVELGHIFIPASALAQPAKVEFVKPRTDPCCDM